MTALRDSDRGLVDGDTVRAHIAHLEACGISRRAIAETAAVSPTGITGIITGRSRRVQAAPARRILTVQPRDCYDRVADRGFVPRVGAVRRIHALYAIGWTAAHIDTRTGIANLAHNTTNQAGTWMSARHWRAVADLYDQLWSTPGPSHVNQRRAARHGWAPPLAWDDDAIDDPAAIPDTGKRGPAGWGVVNADSLTDCAEWGMTTQQAADRLGVTHDAITTALRRGADPDGHLQARFRRNAIARGLDRADNDGLGIPRRTRSAA